MNKIFDLTLKERKVFKENRNIVLIIIICCLMAILGSRNIESFPGNFNNMLSYGILITNFFILGKGFEKNVNRVLYSGVYSRFQIFLSKLISIIMNSIIFYIALILGIMIVSIISNTGLDSMNFINSIKDLSYFILYSCSLALSIFLMTMLADNSNIGAIVTYICYFDLILALFGNALQSSRLSDGVKTIIENLPFYSTNMMFQSKIYTFSQVSVLIIFSMVVFATNCYILHKKEL